jgi:hypothetical protein
MQVVINAAVVLQVLGDWSQMLEVFAQKQPVFVA